MRTDNMIIAGVAFLTVVFVVVGARYGSRPEPRYYEDDMHTVDYDGHQFIVFDHSIIHHPECQCLH